MIWKKLLEEGKIQKKSVSFKETDKVLERAHKTLKSAKFLLEEDSESAFGLAYEAMLIAGRALMFSMGLKPRSVGAYKTTVEFCDSFLGNDYMLLVNKFDRARKKRHYLIYGAGVILSRTEAENLIKTANDFLKIIEKLVDKERKQEKLL